MINNRGEMTNSQWLKEMNTLNADEDKRHEGYFYFVSYGFRQARATEIIAEEAIKTNENLCNIITTLENIETAIRQR